MGLDEVVDPALTRLLLQLSRNVLDPTHETTRSASAPSALARPEDRRRRTSDRP